MQTAKQRAEEPTFVMVKSESVTAAELQVFHLQSAFSRENSLPVDLTGSPIEF
jgi:hypothetical protein